MLLQQKSGSIGVSAGFLIGCERDDDVASRNEVFTFEADQCFQHCGVAVFHIFSAAPVVPTVLLRQLKRIGGPVFTLGFNYVQVPEEQHRLCALLLRTIADNEATLGGLVRRRDEYDIVRRKTSCQELLLHDLRRGGRAMVMRCVDVDQLFQNVACELLVGSFGGRGPGVEAQVVER